MSCIICGKEEHVNEQGFCAVCAEKLTALSDSSSVLRRLSQSPPAAGSPAPGTPPTAQARAADEPRNSSILLRFGQTPECALVYPFSVALDSQQRILVLDQPARDEYRITLHDSEGNFQGVFLRCRKGEGREELKYPKGIALDGHGAVYVPDAGNHRVQRFDARGVCVGPLGRLGQGPGEFDSPCDVDIDEAGCLLVADTYNDRVQKLTPQGLLLLEIGAEADLSGPLGVTADGAGNIYVADTNHHRVTAYSRQGQPLLRLGGEGTGPGKMSFPSDVRVGQDGAIYVADCDNLRIQKFDRQGAFVSEFSLRTIMEAGRTPEGDVAVDEEGCLFLCDKYANVVVKAKLYK
jgi:tripartite motif-containing protein 71